MLANAYAARPHPSQLLVGFWYVWLPMTLGASFLPTLLRKEVGLRNGGCAIRPGVDRRDTSGCRYRIANLLGHQEAVSPSKHLLFHSSFQRQCTPPLNLMGPSLYLCLHGEYLLVLPRRIRHDGLGDAHSFLI